MDRFAPFDLNRFLPQRVSRLAVAMSRKLAGRYGERFGIGVVEWRVIAHLADADKLSVRELHLRAGMAKPRVSRTVEQLVLRGLVTKVASQRDRRLVEVSLTPQGRAMHDAIVPIARQFEASLISTLEPEERAALDAVLVKLAAAVESG